MLHMMTFQRQRKNQYNIAFSVQKDGEVDLLKGCDSLNMEKNSKFLKHRKINDLS